MKKAVSSEEKIQTKENRKKFPKLWDNMMTTPPLALVINDFISNQMLKKAGNKIVFSWFQLS